MNKKGSFWKNKGPSFCCIAAAFVFALVTLLLYLTMGVTTFTPTLSTEIIVLLIVGLAIALVSLWREFELLSYVLYLVLFFTFFQYIGSQATYIASIAEGIDATGISASFVAILAASALSWAAALTGAILYSRRLRKNAGEVEK